LEGDISTSANLAFVNAKVLTMNRAQPCAEAVAVRNDRIVEVGTNEEINKWIGKKTKVIDLSGKILTPGFIDAHIHVSEFGRFLTWIDLRNAKSIEEIQVILRKRVQENDREKWIIGHGWDQTRFEEKRFPNISDLDSASPHNPVVLYHKNEKICVVNSKALELAGVTNQTNPPQGGTVEKHMETSELTGVLRNNATNLIWKAIPEPNEEEILEATASACKKIAEAGVTSVHWMVLSAADLLIAQKLHIQKRLQVRVYMIVPVNLLSAIQCFESDNCSELRVGGAVIAVDGYLATRTAALFNPYSDDLSGMRGKLLCTRVEVKTATAKILDAGLQLVIHAVGDKAVDTALDVIDQESKRRKNLRYRIEQAAVLNEGLVERMRKHQVTVSVQPSVICSEFSVWSVIKHLGPERAKFLYPLKTLLRNGIRVVGGSDCPMEPLNPLLGLQNAVTRKFPSEERIAIYEALSMYTVDAAFSTGEENIKGSIESGKLADLTVLSKDPLTVSPDRIKEITVEMTIIGGRIVYSRSNL